MRVVALLAQLDQLGAAGRGRRADDVRVADVAVGGRDGRVGSAERGEGVQRATRKPLAKQRPGRPPDAFPASPTTATSCPALVAALSSGPTSWRPETIVRGTLGRSSECRVAASSAAAAWLRLGQPGAPPTHRIAPRPLRVDGRLKGKTTFGSIAGAHVGRVEADVQLAASASGPTRSVSATTTVARRTNRIDGKRSWPIGAVRNPLTRAATEPSHHCSEARHARLTHPRP